MTRREAIRLIDDLKRRVADPVISTRWRYMRDIIDQMPDDHWELAAVEVTDRVLQ